MRYLLAVGSAVLFLLGSAAWQEAALAGAFFSLALAAVAVLTLALGAGPGLVLTILVGLGTWYFLQEPRASFSVENARQLTRIVTFFVAAFTVVASIDLLDRTRRKLALAKREAERLLAELRESERALREADRRKNDFLAVLSHELRNPLSPIRNSVYVLERAPPGGEQARHAQAVISRQVRHLTRLIEDLLDVTRIAQGKIRLQRERVELGSLARRVAEDQRPAFAANGVELEVDIEVEPLPVRGDPTRLEQVLGNLLQNSAKFTSSGGRTVLSVWRAGDRSVGVTVEDNGTGMSPETVASLFEPFVQAEKTLHRSKGGLGLGLSLAKGLVEQHGGSIGASSEGVGRGAKFVLTLPLDEAPELQSAAPVEAQPHPA